MRAGACLLDARMRLRSSPAGRSGDRRTSSFGELLGVGRAVHRLARVHTHVPSSIRWRDAQQSVPAPSRESSAVSSLGALLVNRCSGDLAERAGVETGLHAHDRHAGYLVSAQDGALDRGGSTPSGKQRGVHVHEAERRGSRGSRAGGSARTPLRRRCRVRVVASAVVFLRISQGGGSAHRRAELGAARFFTAEGRFAPPRPDTASGRE